MIECKCRFDLARRCHTFGGRRIEHPQRGASPPPTLLDPGLCCRALGSWRSWRLCLQMWKPSDSKQTFCDSANSHLFRRIGSTNMGEIAGGTKFWREYWRDVFEATCQKISENLEKSSPDPPKSSPGASKIEPWSPPRRHF